MAEGKGKFRLEVEAGKFLRLMNPPKDGVMPAADIYCYVGYFDKEGHTRELTNDDRIHTIIVTEGGLDRPNPNTIPPSDSLIISIPEGGIGRCPACFNYAVLQMRVTKQSERINNKLLGEKCHWCGWKRDA